MLFLAILLSKLHLQLNNRLILGTLLPQNCLNGINQCEKLVDEMRAADKAHLSSTKTTEDNFQREIRRLREKWVAEEKIRRETWESDKVRSIKEMTIKGLEPEIQRIITQHKEEKKRLEAKYKEEIRQRLEEAEVSVSIIFAQIA